MAPTNANAENTSALKAAYATYPSSGSSWGEGPDALTWAGPPTFGSTIARISDASATPTVSAHIAQARAGAPARDGREAVIGLRPLSSRAVLRASIREEPLGRASGKRYGRRTRPRVETRGRVPVRRLGRRSPSGPRSTRRRRSRRAQVRQAGRGRRPGRPEPPPPPHLETGSRGARSMPRPRSRWDRRSRGRRPAARRSRWSQSNRRRRSSARARPRWPRPAPRVPRERRSGGRGSGLWWTVWGERRGTCRPPWWVPNEEPSIGHDRSVTVTKSSLRALSWRYGPRGFADRAAAGHPGRTPGHL